MELKRLIIKNYGIIKNLDFVPNDIINCVSETVSNAVCHVLNNRFAIRHYNTVELMADAYLFGEIHHYERGKKIVYTTEIKGLEAPIFTKNGQVLTDDAIDSDPVLSRPYREDNACIFCARSQNSFLDYGGFLSPHFFRLSDYSQSFKMCMENKIELCNIEKNHVVCYNKGKPTVYRKMGKTAIKPVQDLSECDRLCAEYVTFVLLAETLDHYRITKSKLGITPRTPVVVNGLVSGLDANGSNAGFLILRTKRSARQIFFVEKNLDLFKTIVK